MAEYIDREAALIAIKVHCPAKYETEMLARIVCIPAADVVEVRRGKWVYGYDSDTGELDIKAWTCSLCGEKYPWQPHYCPNCGATMEVTDDV